jgi:hypothetical protein
MPPMLLVTTGVRNRNDSWIVIGEFSNHVDGTISTSICSYTSASFGLSKRPWNSHVAGARELGSFAWYSSLSGLKSPKTCRTQFLPASAASRARGRRRPCTRAASRRSRMRTRRARVGLRFARARARCRSACRSPSRARVCASNLPVASSFSRRKRLGAMTRRSRVAYPPQHEVEALGQVANSSRARAILRQARNERGAAADELTTGASAAAQLLRPRSARRSCP